MPTSRPVQMPWIKLYTALLDDTRLNRLPVRAQLNYYKLSLLSGRLDAGGAFIQDGKELTIDGIAWILRANTEELQEDINALQAAGLITINGRGPELAGWEEDQGPTQADKRGQWLARQNRHRGTTPAPAPAPAPVTSDNRVNTALITLTEEIREDKEKDKRRKEQDPAQANLNDHEPDQNTPSGSRFSYSGAGLGVLDRVLSKTAAVRALSLLGVNDPGRAYDNMAIRISVKTFLATVAAVLDSQADNPPGLLVHRLREQPGGAGLDRPCQWHNIPPDVLAVFSITRTADQ